MRTALAGKEGRELDEATKEARHQLGEKAVRVLQPYIMVYVTSHDDLHRLHLLGIGLVADTAFCVGLGVH
ncbi:hypothetical protein ETB97_007648 [Aspergillus alliaceus]|uniref:Uncharacterized protein n=1 Tax=Petromyces alliaceus TaxID=209559 RepID=A0A8H5ZTY1_PETAA|nr:hypothetical protein ETB97_007648 [Aspergillus burnettii]